MSGAFKILSVVLVMMFAVACIKPFNPPAITAANLNYLVVDGFITPGTASTIKLSRTLNISDSFMFVPELNAQLYIEGLSGSSFSFQGGQNGSYTTTVTSLTPDDQYRLRIVLADGKQYLSDYVVVKQSPPIDSVEWEEEDDISIFVNTHDPTGNARYYKWEFEETVGYKALYDSFLDYKDGQIIFLEPHEYRYECFKFFNSTNIVIGTSTGLSEDVIRRARVTIFPNDYSRVATRYSINVKQYSLTPEAYKYWQILQANTEQNGNLFDPQPAQLRSNIHNTADPNEPVVGFLSISNYTEKRIFIRYFDLKHRPEVPYLTLCEVTFISSPDDFIQYLDNGEFLPAYFQTGRGLAVAPAICVDCRKQGGVIEKPPFW